MRLVGASPSLASMLFRYYGLQSVEFSVFLAEMVHQRLVGKGRTCNPLCEFGRGIAPALGVNMLAKPLAEQRKLTLAELCVKIAQVPSCLRKELG